MVVGTTAARLHELWLPSVPDELHLATAVPGISGVAMTRTRRPEIRAHRRQLPANDVCLIDGVRMTTVARTWRDLAPVLDLPSLVAASAPDLPRFEVNEPVYRSDGGWLAEPDLSLAEAKIALEYQGADHAEVRRMRKDIARSTDMRRDRWVVIEYRPAEVFGRPQLIAPELRSLVRERAPHLLGLRPRRRLVT